jgi:catechol 2,3-dioxygenase-like lactoylglutathione lyase family enzyme
MATDERHESVLRIAAVSLDCADPARLADFYVRLLGGQVLWRKDNSVGVRVGSIVLVPQRVPDYRPPTWPGGSVVHLDLTAGDVVDEPAERAIALGARLADPQPDPRWRVLLDPAGHPFCITPFAPPLE